VNVSNKLAMKNIFITIVFAFISSQSIAQTFKENHNFGIALSYAPKEVNVSIAWRQMHKVAIQNNFKLGYGLRYNGYLSNDKQYTTAPAYLTSGEKGPQVIFKENIQENIDTFSLHNAQHNSVNTVIFIEYDINPQWSVGFNIDAVGISFGGSRVGKIISSNRPSGDVVSVKALPTRFNVLLVSDNDIGMLNSELYVSRQINEKWSVNAGFTFLFTEYTTDQKIVYNDNNDRFRHKSLLGMLSVNYNPFKK
jgi:outer membrane receptor for monomeric catechols